MILQAPMLETGSRPLDNSFESAKDVPSAAMTRMKVVRATRLRYTKTAILGLIYCYKTSTAVDPRPIGVPTTIFGKKSE